MGGARLAANRVGPAIEAPPRGRQGCCCGSCCCSAVPGRVEVVLVCSRVPAGKGGGTVGNPSVAT
eukprot:2015443-Prorocentrum_lima.AAC.1